MNSRRLLHWLKVPTQVVRLYHSRRHKELFLIGVPFSGGQPREGVDKGPAFLRQHGLVNKLHKLGYTVSDFGELEIPLTETENHNYITCGTTVNNSLECGAVAHKLSEEVAKATREGKVSLTIGGDHSIAVGTVHGHATTRKNACLLWIDAHMDLNTPSTSLTGNLHGMPLSFLIKGVSQFAQPPGYEWCSPCLFPEDVAYIGLRDIDPGEREICDDLGIAAYTIDDIDKDGIGEIIQKALERINPSGTRPIHVSYDIDSLDPKEAPSTGVPVKGGLTMDEGIYIAQVVAQTGCLSAIDMVEFNPAIGTEEEVTRTAMNMMELIKILLGKKSHLTEAPLPPVDKDKAEVDNGLPN